MSAAVALCYSGASAFHGTVSAPTRQRSVVMETKAEMVELAKQLNPVVGYWDPLGLSDANLWNQGEEVCTSQPLGFVLRHRAPTEPLPPCLGSSPSAGFASRS